MPLFRPTRASPSPSRTPGGKKTGEKLTNLGSFDITISTNTSSSSTVLSNLSEEEISVIDSIIQRASTATAFLTVYKVYNEVLQERGLDSGNDVVYYKLLLKIGVVKGHDWGAKWDAVKTQYGFHSKPSGTETKTHEPRTPIKSDMSRTPISQVPPAPRFLWPDSRPLRSDSLTVHSHESGELTDDDASESSESSSGPKTLPSQEKLTNGPPVFGLQRKACLPPLPSIDQFLPVTPSYERFPLHDQTELDKAHESDSDSTVSSHPRLKLEELSARSPSMKRILIPVQSGVLQQTDRPKDDDTWTKVKIIRDEKEADRYREIVLLEKCWRLWREGLHWIQSTSDKAARTREKILLRTFLGVWHARFAAHVEAVRQVQIMADARLLKRALLVWHKRVRLKAAIAWREEMRRKMSIVRERRNINIQMEVWKSWRKQMLLKRVESMLNMKAYRMLLYRWRDRLMHVYRLEDRAHEFLVSCESHRALAAWDTWKRQTIFRGLERNISQRISVRFADHAWCKWKERMSSIAQAEAFRDNQILRSTSHLWKQAVDRLRSLQQKADRYRNRQEMVLLRAILHVWIAKERGNLLERVTNSRLLHNAISKWHNKLKILATMDDRAKDFSERPNSSLILSSYRQWIESVTRRRNGMILACRLHDEGLQHRLLLHWRIVLRAKLRMYKQAKAARKYLLMKQVWERWKTEMIAKKREKKLLVANLKTAGKYFRKWQFMAIRKINERKAQAIISTRIQRNALTAWTNKVISIKSRELDTIEHRHASQLYNCFTKWRAVLKHHKDDLQLMQSYQIVRKEEILRRSFHRWLSSAKSARHRRVTLQERENEVKLGIVAEAWDRWREKLQGERLRPLEKALEIQTRKHVLYRTFVLWHSKTRSTPAIRFDAVRTKAKYWHLWRKQMPKALMAKKARDQERKKILTKILDKWVQAYRTKIALKAVARARYLRLPSGLPRQSLPLSSALSGILRSSPSVSEQPKRLSFSTEEQSDGERIDQHSKFRAKKPSSLRSVSPAPTTYTHPLSDSNVKDSNSLWLELRRLRKRSPSEPR